MILPTNRWLFDDEGKTRFKFGKFDGEALEDVIESNRWYIEKVMFGFDDLTSGVEAFLKEALRIDGDPLLGPEPIKGVTIAAPGDLRVAQDAQRLRALKEKAAKKLEDARIQRQFEARREAEEKEAEVVRQRKEDAEW